jgi:UDP-N-acetylmuramyl pentapeptide synthase
MTPGEAGPEGPALRLSAAWVAAQMRGVVTSGASEREFGDVSIDTRTLKAGDLYFGVRGDRFDGGLRR